jgi:hypothetical protein
VPRRQRPTPAHGPEERGHHHPAQTPDSPTRPGYAVINLNGDPLDCRRKNLRRVRSNDQWLSKPAKAHSNSHTGYPGVAAPDSTGRFRASIFFRGRRMSLGRFKNDLQASRAYEKAATSFDGRH